MTAQIADQVIEQLKNDQPDVEVVHITHEIAPDIFDEQKAKHLAHGARGGVIGIILTPDDKIVLAHRSKLNAGWSLPGGTVEKDETFEDTFKREIQEEVGVQVSSARLVLVEKKLFVSSSREELHFVLATYLAHMNERVLPQPTEDALREGLKIELFGLNDLPKDMIFSDKEKVERLTKKPRHPRFKLSTSFVL